jgi:hypothetical protein
MPEALKQLYIDILIKGYSVEVVYIGYSFYTLHTYINAQIHGKIEKMLMRKYYLYGWVEGDTEAMKDIKGICVSSTYKL